MSMAFQLQKVDERIFILNFDLKDEKVNKFSSAVMEELRAMIADLRERTDIKCLLLTSSKPGIFIAGADVKEIEAVDNEQRGYEVGRAGQEVFTEFEELPFLKIAVIDGACMGGGTELSLCCDYRLASDSPKTKIALPEVNLGILPGWGGTQRLPRLVGIQRALDIILTGRNLNAKRALRSGLVDAIVPAEWVRVRAVEIAKEILDGKGEKYSAKRKPKGVPNAFLEKTPLGRKLIFGQAEKMLLKKTQGHYPAPLLALKTIQKTIGLPLKEGLEIEARALGELIPTAISKNLVQVFFWTEEIKKENGTTVPDLKGKDISKAGILGAGVMGGGIAQLFAVKNIPARVKDISFDAVAKAYQQAASVLKSKVKKRRMSRLQFNQVMNRITGTVDYSGFNSADIVVEAIVEDLKIKKMVLAELEGHTDKETVIATNTSSLLVDDMATALKNKERFVGMHFFNPVHRMPLVEVVRGSATADEAVATVFNLTKKLGKTPIVVNDGPGFLVNRLLVPYMVEAISILEQGNSIQNLDRALKKFGMPMGPIELFDEVGIDVAQKVAKILQKTMGDRMAESDLLDKLIADNRLGKKNGTGFYKYQGRKKEYDPAIDNYIELKEKLILDSEEIVKRCVYPMVNEAARCLQEGIVQKPRDVDVGMIFGTGFAPFRGGLLRYAEAEGLDKIVEVLQQYAQTYGPRFTPSEHLIKLARAGNGFYGD